MDLAGMKRRELQALCKRHGLPAGGTNADLVARLDAALSAAAGAEEEVAGVPARKVCLKQTGGDAAEAKKVTFAAEEPKARRLRSRVIWSPVVAKTRGKSAQADTDSAAAAEDSISAEVGADVPLRRSRRNSVSAAVAEELGAAVPVDRKRKRKNQENDESIVDSAQAGVSSRVTRRSSLAGAAVVLPPAVEKKRGRGKKAAGGSNELVSEAQDCESDVKNFAQVEVSARITRSRATAPVVLSPAVVENKRKRKTGDAQTNVELPSVSDVPRNDAPVTRSLRNRVVQVNNSMVDETPTARQQENKTQPNRAPTRRHQQVSSSVVDKNQEQIAAPNKAPLLRRSGRNHSEDAEKQPPVQEPVKRSRKSVVLATLEKEENDLIEQKKPQAHVRKSMRKSIVPVRDIKGIGEQIQNANSEDAAKQPATKEPVRGSRRKSVVAELHEKEKGLTAEKNIEAHEERSMQKPVMPVKDIKAVGEGIQNAKGKHVEKQFVVKQPTRRSSRKSVLPDMIENNSGLIAAVNGEMNVRRSTRKSVLPNMLNVENQDQSKMAIKKNFQSGKRREDERQQKVKEPIRRLRWSVVAIPLQEQNNGLYKEKISKIPMRRSTRKSVALNEVEKVSMDDTEIVAQEPESVGEEGLKLRKHRRSSLELSSSANDLWKMEDFDGEKFRKQQNAQIPNEKDITGGTQQALNSTTLERRSSKRRRTTASEVRSVKEANDDIIVREARNDAHKGTLEYKESGSKVQESGQVNATREEHSSDPLLVTVALIDEISTAQSVPVVIPGSESGDNANENSDKSKQESSCIAVPHNFAVSEDKALMSKDGLSVNFNVGDREGQSPISRERRVGLEANASNSGEKNLTDIMSTGLHANSLQHHTDIIAEETGEVAEESIRAADLGKCPSRRSIGNPLSSSLHLEAAADDTSLPVLSADTGCSLNGRPSSFDLELMFAEGCKESYDRKAENTAVELDGGNKPSTPVTPGFYVRSDCLEDEHVQPTECDADEKLDVDEGVAEEFLAQEEINDQHVPGKTDLNMKLNGELACPGTESGCSITEKNARHVADNLDEQAIILVQQGDVQEAPLPEEIGGGNKPSSPVKLDFYVGSDCLEDEDVQPTECDADKKLDVDQGVAEEEVLAMEKGSDQHIPAKTDLNMTINDEPAGPGTESGCGVTEKNARLVANNIDKQAIILVQQDDVQEGTPLPEEIGGANKPSTPITPDFYEGSDCLEDEDVQPTGFDADKKFDIDQSVAEEDVLAQKKSNDQHVPTKTDLNMKLNNELAGPCMESGCSITEKNARFFADNLDQQAIFQVQQGDVQEGDLKKPSPCSTTPECKHRCGVLPPKNTGYLSSAEQSPFGLESLFSLENIDESMGSAIAHTKSGFNDSKDCHVKSALENTHVSEPYSHDDSEEGISKNDDCMQRSQQDNGMEGLPEANLDEERVLSVFSLDAKHIKEVINFEEVACEAEANKKLVHSEELKASSEKTNVNGLDGNAYGITDAVLSSALHTPGNDNNEICLVSNTDVLHQGHNDQCSDDREDITEDASTKYIEGEIILPSGKESSNLKDGQLNSKLEGAKVAESGLYFNKHIGNIIDSGSVVGEITPSSSGLSKDSSKEYRQEVLDGFPMETSLHGSSTCGKKIVCRDAIENPSVTSATPGYTHDGALSQEVACTMKNYAGTCSSSPRELFMELQSLIAKGNTKESDPHEGLAFPSAEYSGDESINVEQRVKVHHGSDLSHLDELIGCSNSTEVLRQGHNHKDRSSVDRLEQVATEPCTNDIVEAAAAAKCIESGLVLPLSEERSNLNDGQLNPKLESPNIMVSGLNYDKDVRNTSDNGSIAVVVGERTPSGCGLPQDYPKDHYPRQELLDGLSVESSLQGTTFEKTIVSGEAGIGNHSSSLATPDYKYEGALSEKAVCRMTDYTGTTSLVDPRHLFVDLQSLFSEGSAEKSDLQDNLTFPSAESGKDERIIYHVEKLVGTHVASEPDTYQGPCQDLSRHEEKESCMSVPMQVKESGGFLRSSHMKGSLTSVQIDLADDARLIERDIVAAVEVLCEEKVERKFMPTSDSDILQEKSYSNGHGICQSSSQKHIVEANSRLLSCGTEVLHQDHKEERNEPNEGICQPRCQKHIAEANSRLVACDTEVLHQDHEEECSKPNEDILTAKARENNTAEDVPIEGMGSPKMPPSVVGKSEMPNEQVNAKLSDGSEELSFSCDNDTTENFCTGPANRDLYSLHKDFHIDSCQKQEVPEVLSLPKSPEGSTKFQCVSVSGSGPCQQRVNESTIMQVTYSIETLNQDHKEYNQNNEDHTTPGVPASSVPEPVEIEQSEMEKGLIPATETSVLTVLDEQPNSKLEGNEDQITPGILASSVPEAVEIEQSEMEIGLIPAAETSVLLVPDEQPNSKLEVNEVDEHSSYGKDFSILFDSKPLKIEASNLHKDDCMDLSSEYNNPNDLPAPRSPEQSAYLQNNNDSGSVAGSCQTSRRSGISELRAKLQSFKVSSAIKGSYIAMSAPRPKPGDSMSQSAIALLRNIENTPAVKAGHPVKPNADGKDSSRRALQPISGRPREH